MRESLSSAVPEEAPVTEAQRRRKEQQEACKEKDMQENKRPDVPAKAGGASEPVREDDYDGYYDDVRPIDEGEGVRRLTRRWLKDYIGGGMRSLNCRSLCCTYVLDINSVIKCCKSPYPIV